MKRAERFTAHIELACNGCTVFGDPLIGPHVHVREGPVISAADADALEAALEQSEWLNEMLPDNVLAQIVYKPDADDIAALWNPFVEAFRAAQDRGQIYGSMIEHVLAAIAERARSKSGEK